MVDVKWKRGDTVPLEATLPDDLSNANTVSFHMADENRLLINNGAQIVDAGAGEVAYQWGSDETDRTGIFEIEWEVEYNDGAIETYPKDGFNTIEFIEGIA